MLVQNISMIECSCAKTNIAYLLIKYIYLHQPPHEMIVPKTTISACLGKVDNAKSYCEKIISSLIDAVQLRKLGSTSISD